MDDCSDTRCFNLVDTSSYIISTNSVIEESNERESGNLFSSHPLEKRSQRRQIEKMYVYTSRPLSTGMRRGSSIPKPPSAGVKNTTNGTLNTCPPGAFCQLRWESIIKLKDSTKKLLLLIEDIQSKTHSKELPDPDPTKSDTKKIQSIDGVPSTSDFLVAPALKELETSTKALNTIFIEKEEDDCSIFKRLTRKCNCLNHQEYNDFVIHFNEETKYYTNTSGEIIKNMRILKKFLYMGGKYTTNALIFLNEGLADQSSYTEKVEITQGCSYSDMCNVFEDNSLVITCISWPCKYEYYGDNDTQNLAASFLYKLAQLEEGRRYLKYTSKITNDIKKVLKKSASKLDMVTTESLNSTLNLIHPSMAENQNVTFYSRPIIDEGYANEIAIALIQCREYMTSEEILKHLKLLQKLSNDPRGKTDLTSFLPALLLMFKKIVMDYDNSEMNILITKVLNNIVSVNMLKQKDPHYPKTMTIADIATEPIKMKNEIIQMPAIHKKSTKKGSNKSKSHLHSTHNKFRQPSGRKVPDAEMEESQSLFAQPRLLNRSQKFL